MPPKRSYSPSYEPPAYDSDDEYIDDDQPAFNFKKNSKFRSRAPAPTSRAPKKISNIIQTNKHQTTQEAVHEMSSRATSRVTKLQIRDFSSPYSNFSSLEMHDDHVRRPLYVCPDAKIYLETSSELYLSAYDFIVAIADPISRPEHLQEYQLTPFSLYAGTACGITGDSIIRRLESLSKNHLHKSVKDFIHNCTRKYGKVKIVLRDGGVWIESEEARILKELLDDDRIKGARIRGGDLVGGGGSGGADSVSAITTKTITSIQGIETTINVNENGEEVDVFGFVVRSKETEMSSNLKMLEEDMDGDDDSESDDDDEEEEDENGNVRKKAKKVKIAKPLAKTVSFQINPLMSELVKRASLELDYPLMEEYDFRADKINPNLPMDLKPNTRIRQYQERSLSKMFGNGRARSGIIVLPCGAGKTLTGVTAAQTLGKSCIVLCTNAVSVLQWKYQFKLWSTIPDDRITCFTSQDKEKIHEGACVLITTYTMVSYSGQRSEESEDIMKLVRGREWGLMMMDEVHVVPAKTFRQVIGNVRAHTRLGLTATLVREDDLISDLNFLIGPKLYEANWMDLTDQGYLANVRCVEVWCPLTPSFMKAYLNEKEMRKKQLLYVMNPAKMRTVDFLVKYHEARGDKIIIFSDLVYGLIEYAKLLGKPFIFGGTPERERQKILGCFRSDASISTLCLSKVGDTSIDLPEANVIIQISSHFGSRRQEAQRLGRILRPKQSTATDGTNRDSFNAHFYSLVSTDTQEMYYSTKRQQYLIDQGYTFKIVTNLHEKAHEASKNSDGLCSTIEKELNVLRDCLAANASDAQDKEDKDIKKDTDNVKTMNVTEMAVMRKSGGLAGLAGGGGFEYKERVGGGGGGGGDGKKRNPLFKARFVGK